MSPERLQAVLGIRREDKSTWERRTPLAPQDVARHCAAGVRIQVQRSPQRCFPDDEYARAGAQLVDDMSGATVVLGVKEVPADLLERGKTYLFFSHTMKGQPYNMPMLRRLVELECTLVDYELVRNEEGLRTIAFGRHAGLAGAIDTLWALGERFSEGGHDTPLSRLRPALEYGEVSRARADIEAAGREIAEHGFPEDISPVAIGVTGRGGKVYGGAMEVLGFLPAEPVEPEDLEGRVAAHTGRGKSVLAVGYAPRHLVEPARAGREYSFPDYKDNPGAYRARFGPHLTRLSAVIHGIFWREGFPRFILRTDLCALSGNGARPKLQVITDVTCDLEGSNEALVRITEPGSPAYMYDPATGEARNGTRGKGVCVVAVDILPAEIPVDSSLHFSRRLSRFVPSLARGTPDPQDAALPTRLRRGVLVHRGRLVPPWDERLAEPLRTHGGPE